MGADTKLKEGWATVSGAEKRHYFLAGWFLSNVPSLATDEKRRALAQAIQDEIEIWIEWETWTAARIEASAENQ